ncbi:MAG TPA: 3-hydroxyacyl-CoA dehydrogenase NAD-binding domain-containing protein [Puia sp.]|nr:3-hydroxyacyl-CoA dehydrogenase NAD-binding domain-containing protein [Puia sp.]
MDIKCNEYPILIIGNGKLAYSVTVCLSSAGHRVTLMTDNKDEAAEGINNHFLDMARFRDGGPKAGLPEIAGFDDRTAGDYKIGIGITSEDPAEKRPVILRLEGNVGPEGIIAINTESIPLSSLQEGCVHPERLIGLNWVEPAHTTFFLELIINERTVKGLADDVYMLAKDCWGKDPYLISRDTGIRARLLSGLVREAFYLVQNGYASIEDIDRACKNDAGYYLPFAGNFRYMDLMGPYAYGLVMKDLNRELSKDAQIPPFFKEIMDQGGLGMDNNKGFYEYDEDEVKRWNEIFRTFSFQIQDIIGKSPI